MRPLDWLAACVALLGACSPAFAAGPIGVGTKVTQADLAGAFASRPMAPACRPDAAVFRKVLQFMRASVQRATARSWRGSKPLVRLP